MYHCTPPPLPQYIKTHLLLIICFYLLYFPSFNPPPLESQLRSNNSSVPSWNTEVIYSSRHYFPLFIKSMTTYKHGARSLSVCVRSDATSLRGRLQKPGRDNRLPVKKMVQEETCSRRAVPERGQHRAPPGLVSILMQHKKSTKKGKGKRSVIFLGRLKFLFKTKCVASPK